jgi:hypothetical protein
MHGTRWHENKFSSLTWKKIKVSTQDRQKVAHVHLLCQETIQPSGEGIGCRYMSQQPMESPGIDPGASRMLSERSAI